MSALRREHIAFCSTSRADGRTGRRFPEFTRAEAARSKDSCFAIGRLLGLRKRDQRHRCFLPQLRDSAEFMTHCLVCHLH